MQNFQSIRFLLLAGLTISLLSLTTGCKKKEVVHVYTIPKEESQAVVPGQAPNQQASSQNKESAPESNSAMTAALVSDANKAATPEWHAPAQWEPLPLGQLRKGSWNVSIEAGQADISVLAFPGDVGGDFANVNRWREQLGLTIWAQEEFEDNIQSIVVDGFPGKKIELGLSVIPSTTPSEPKLTATPTQKSILGVIVRVQDITWYFKMMGDSTVVQSQKQPFLDFINTVQFSKIDMQPMHFPQSEAIH